MSALLHEIQTDAIDASVPLSNVLRKCAVLAGQLKNDELRDWAFNELNGYKDDVPPYRVVTASTQANLHAEGWEYRAHHLPASIMPKELRQRALRVTLRQPVATLEAWVKSDGQAVTFPWPGDLVALVQRDGAFEEGAEVALHAIWQDVSKAAITGILDIVRNRVLEFCLLLAKQEPELLDANAEAAPTPGAEQAAKTVYNQVFVSGNYTGNVAIGSPAATQTTTVEQGDLAALVAALQDLGIPKKEVKVLEDAISSEKQIGGLGPKVKEWLERAPKAIASGTWKVAGGVTASVITKLVLSYFNIPV